MFHEDVTFRSPVVFKPYEGREQVLKVLRAGERVLGDGGSFRYLHQLEDARRAARRPQRSPPRSKRWQTAGPSPHPGSDPRRAISRDPRRHRLCACPASNLAELSAGSPAARLAARRRLPPSQGQSLTRGTSSVGLKA
ncbi:MAG: hypothetical protein JOZ07_07165 [Solirubrobacterales bacterium]|nr:hypothetical protein [Solirubrobacterales bacterium]